uniref:NADH-ubiquinone oxidoreductase chain 6 n=1 Tax=Termes hospes TaxID=187522 RepID=A0A0U1XV88_9NEOP|nr:NADH dehydrogenase subunit 6 [Termes hospes]AIZ68320.1 NADH dehydrogenase subunit 6 [Termes hospes]
MMKLLMATSTMTSLMFTQMKHPMAMGLMLLMQTTLVCLISGTMYSSFWFSYILFMIMIGGMLVLFMYNNKTSIKRNILTIKQNTSGSSSGLGLIMMMPITMYLMPTTTNNKEMSMHETMMENEITTTTTVMYNQTMGIMTMLLVLYMLLTLIVVVNIINVSKGPLRHTS